jgi:type I restriction enzyme R subunit
MTKLNENSLAEQPVLDWLRELGYEIAFGPDIAPLGAFQERDDYRGVLLHKRLERSIRRLNPDLPDVGVEAAVRAVERVADEPRLIFANKEFYEFLTRGVKVEYRDSSGTQKVYVAQLVDFDDPANNEFLAVNQYSIQGADSVRRPDVVVFVNGIPLAVFELKNPTTVSATAETAIAQLDGYKSFIPGLFVYNQVLVVSDGQTFTKHGTISSTPEWFAEWRFTDEEKEEREDATLPVLLRGMFHKDRFLDIIRNFMVFEADSVQDASTYTKKMCKYHQYYGVVRAAERAQRAVTDKRVKGKVGVFWHTQGSGKTLSMVFLVNKLRFVRELKSPTVLFLTDRNDLDDQIHKTFALTGYATLAKRIEDTAELGKKLSNPGAEILFSTIQKFQGYSEILSENENILVIADEAHRSQYAHLAGNVRAALPNALLMGITGTPISFADRDTRLAFGDFISVYRIDQAEADHATVPIYYEGRLIPLEIDNPNIDADFSEINAGALSAEEEARLKRRFAKFEEAIAAPERLDKVAKDIVEHFNGRGQVGKAMVATISKRAAVDLYKRIVAQPNAPETAVVLSGLSEFAGEVQDELNEKQLERRFKNPGDSLRLVIVCDMWLTGFDVPPLHTIYIDKPLKGHTLMQAIARVNRIYKDKPGGLIVDYIGVVNELKKALSVYSSKGQKTGIFPLEEAIVMMRAKHAKVKQYFTGVEFDDWRKLESAALNELFTGAVAAVLGPNDSIDQTRVDDFLSDTEALFKLHALVMPHRSAHEIRTDVSFFQAVRSILYKRITPPPPPGTGISAEKETAIRDLLSESIRAANVIDIFATKDKEKPEISIFDERFLEEARKMRFKNVAIEVLRKLLQDELRVRARRNEARYATLLELLEDTIERYENNIIASAEVIEKLIELARELRGQEDSAKQLGLSEEELAFYDTLAKGKRAIGKNDKINEIVKDLVSIIRRDVSVDWADNEVVKSRIRANVRRLLLQNGVPAEDTESMVEQIIAQARLLFGFQPGMMAR